MQHQNCNLTGAKTKGVGLAVGRKIVILVPSSITMAHHIIITGKYLSNKNI